MRPGIKKRMIIYPIIYILLGAFLFYRQRSMIYFPTAAEAHRHAELTLSNEGESIKVIVLHPGQERAIIYFGGNAEAVVYNASDFEQHFPDFTVYLFNYRGYGGSSGQPTEQGVFSDALALYDQIRAQHSSISSIGRSLGSGVAAYLAAERDIHCLVLATPFDSILRVAQRRFPIYPLRLLLLDHYNTISRVRAITAPVLVLMAENDRVIPRKSSLRLVAAFPVGQITAVTIKEAGHNTLSEFPEYYEQVQRFMGKNPPLEALTKGQD